MTPLNFPPRDEVVAFVRDLNVKYGDRPVLATLDLLGAVIELRVDLEGLLVWIPDYLRLRVIGYTHLDATLDVFAAIDDIWDPAGAPHKRPDPPTVIPAPAPEIPPAPIPPPDDRPGVLDNMIRFARFYRERCRRMVWAPDARTTHDEQMQFLRDTILEFRGTTGDKSFVMKRADAGRPVSNEVIVFMADPASGDYRRFWDFLRDAGRSNWTVLDTEALLGRGTILPPEQLLVDPVTLNTIVG